VKPGVIAASDEAGVPPHEHPGKGSARLKAGAGPLLEAALTRENLHKAWKRVKANKGAAGVDGLDIEQTAQLLRTNWPQTRQALLAGTYRPQPVRRVMIPEPDGSQALLAHLKRIKVARLAHAFAEEQGLPWAALARPHSERLGGGAQMGLGHQDRRAPQPEAATMNADYVPTVQFRTSTSSGSSTTNWRRGWSVQPRRAQVQSEAWIWRRIERLRQAGLCAT
jgi:hypothetical protein